ncbi:MAG: hypothetical protein ACE5F1_08290 [Planctomycetota bacterium]
MDGNANRRVGWACAAAGVALGMLLGLWSFDGPLDVPAWVGDYQSVPRRLIRLGHIALIALGILNILLGRELVELRLGPGAKRAASVTMNTGNVLLPVTLLVAAFLPAAKYLMSIPAICVLVALCLAARGVHVPEQKRSKT